jgi:hypothetical protein
MNKEIIIKENQLNNIISPTYKNSVIVEHIISLVESRGMFKGYDSIIDPIIRYCDSYLKERYPYKTEEYTNSDNKTFKFYRYRIIIPDKLLSSITWANNKELIINVVDMDEEAIDMLGNENIVNFRRGYSENSRYDKIDDNGKLNSLRITISVFSVNKNIFYQNFHSALYHEFTHAFENYNRLKKNSNGLFRHLVGTNYSKIMSSNNDDKNLNLFNYVNYMLLVNTELNALIASTYGDLQRIHSVRNNFSKDIKQTDAYKTYDDIKNNYLPTIIKLNDDYWKMFQDMTYLQKDKKLSANRFKNEFIKAVDFKLNNLIKGIGRVASQYYDDIEMKEKMAETKIIQP